MEKTAVFIDGVNLYASCKAIEMQIDYKRFLDFFDAEFDYLLRASYFSPIIDEHGEKDKKRPLLDYIAHNGYDLHTRVSKKFTREDGSIGYRGNTDMDLTVAMLRLAYTGKVSHIVLVSGNGDFVPVVEEIKNLGIEVTVISTENNGRGSISSELKRACDVFIELTDIQAEIENADYTPSVISEAA